MILMYIHTHSAERCLGDKPKEALDMMARLRQGCQEAGIKILGSYMAPHEHTDYTIFETDNLPALERVLQPKTLWGTARLIPVVAMEQLEQYFKDR
jgi:hypothetical protein